VLTTFDGAKSNHVAPELPVPVSGSQHPCLIASAYELAPSVPRRVLEQEGDLPVTFAI